MRIKTYVTIVLFVDLYFAEVAAYIHFLFDFYHHPVDNVCL